MKRITFTVSEQEHADIKTAAASARLSIRDYFLKRPKQELGPKLVYKPVSQNVSEQAVEGLDDDGNMRPRPGATKKICPFCKKQLYTEYAQKHYDNAHEGAQA